MTHLSCLRRIKGKAPAVGGPDTRPRSAVQRSRARLPVAPGTTVPLAAELGSVGMLARPAHSGRMTRLMAFDHAFPLLPPSP
ncbi:hypothetical protein ABT218_23945 [Streptomyces sp. NPDC001455]|uniref:hypothetical protein n=1 Tax=Streptomyces sp. NPDC001455 TaxID=3154518 RepID=UPI0033334DEF